MLSPFGPEKKEIYLGPKEMQSIRTVPELVFVNCCHVGARERLQLLASDDKFRHPYNRPEFAATLAQNSSDRRALRHRCRLGGGR